MISITKKEDVKSALEESFRTFESEGLQGLIKEIDRRLLLAKIRFPLLEFCSSEIFNRLEQQYHIEFCSGISTLDRIGGNVLIGIILQKRFPLNINQSLEKAAEYIAQGKEWYVTDIIGERVFGVALLKYNKEAIRFLSELANHENPFVVRSIGPGAHYAIKKGLSEKDSEVLFNLLLSLSGTKEGEIKRGIGWAAKTTAKFHPGIISKYSAQINDTEKTGAWFRTKVRIGLDRHSYAKANSGKKHTK